MRQFPRLVCGRGSGLRLDCRFQGGHDVCRLAGSPGADASTLPSGPRCGPCPPCRPRPRGTGSYVSGSIHAALRTEPGPEPLIGVGDPRQGFRRGPAVAPPRLSARPACARQPPPNSKLCGMRSFDGAHGRAHNSTRVASRRLHLLADDRRSTALRGFLGSVDTASGNEVRRLRLHRACPMAVLVLAVLTRLKGL
jgi:hypothetical protein